MIISQTPVALETLVGGGVFGMLVVVMAAFLRRTKETDERRDDVSKSMVDTALAREARAWEERDRVWAQLETERRQWAEERRAWRHPPNKSDPNA